MPCVKEVGNGLFYIDLDDDEDVNVTDELLHETRKAFGNEPEISQEELDILSDHPIDQSLTVASDTRRQDQNRETASAQGGPVPQHQHSRQRLSKVPR